MGTSGTMEFTRQEVRQHSTKNDLWGIVDGYVLDLTDFVKHHPGGVDNIMKILHENNFSFSRGANAHFGATAAAFAEACKDFENQGRPEGFEFTFQNSRANGGLDRNGGVVGRASAPVGTIKFVGKVKK